MLHALENSARHQPRPTYSKQTKAQRSTLLARLSNRGFVARYPGRIRRPERGSKTRVRPLDPAGLRHPFGMARPAGFEPATGGLEGRCSIQLSYGRKSVNLPDLSADESTTSGPLRLTLCAMRWTTSTRANGTKTSF